MAQPNLRFEDFSFYMKNNEYDREYKKIKKNKMKKFLIFINEIF